MTTTTTTTHTAVYIERSGQTDLAKAREAGIDWLVWCVRGLFFLALLFSFH
jgi:hypothetical protein